MLVNLTDSSLYIQEGNPDEPLVEKTFKVMPQPSGTSNFRAYVVSGDGQIEKNNKDVAVTIKDVFTK